MSADILVIDGKLVPAPRFPHVRTKLPSRGSARSIVDVVSLDLGAAGVSIEHRIEWVRSTRSMNYHELVAHAKAWVTVVNP